MQVRHVITGTTVAACDAGIRVASQRADLQGVREILPLSQERRFAR